MKTGTASQGQGKQGRQAQAVLALFLGGCKSNCLRREARQSPQNAYKSVDNICQYYFYKVMLLRRISSLKYAFSSNGRFEWEKALYDPSKHIYMSRRGMPMLYDSLWEVGNYPDNHFFNSIAPKTYEPQIIDTLIKILNETYGVKPTPSMLEERGFRTWERLFKKDLKIKVDPHVIITRLLNQLAVNIFVKESRFTWPLEQKLRLDYTSLHFDIEEPATLTEFLEFYNKQIEQLVLISNLGYSPNIDQENYALERQLLINSYEAENPAPLIQIAANRQTLLNKMLVWSHKL